MPAFGILSLLLILSGWLFATKNETGLSSGCKTGDEKGIVFLEDDWEKAMQNAKQSGKLIFVDVYADWCGPCRQLKKTSFKDPKTATFFNEHFINLSLNIEKGMGPDLGARWNVRALPTLLIADSNGKLLSQTIGFLSAGKLLEWAQQSESNTKK